MLGYAKSLRPIDRMAVAGAAAGVHRSKLLHALLSTCALAALVSLVLEFGFDTPPLPQRVLLATQLLAVAVYVLSRVYGVAIAADRWKALRSNWVDGILLFGAVAFVFIWLGLSVEPVLKASTVYVGVMQVVLLIRLGIEGVRLNLALSRSKLHPARLLAVTFVTLIFLGTAALSLPKATNPDLWERPGFSLPRHILNCAFTATSAACVTGLVVYDTGSDFTLFGQVVIVVLIQLGGLGIMIFGSLFALLAGKQLSLKESLILQDAISHETLGEMRTMVLFVVAFVFSIETVGAALLYPMWEGIASPTARAYHSVFHAVAAFCNAGFALQSDNLVAYRRSWPVYASIAPLIVLGGLGFPVLHDVWMRFRVVVRHGLSRRRGFRLRGARTERRRLTLHTKIVLATTVVLLVIPTLAFVLFESVGRGGGHAPGTGCGEAAMAHATLPGRFLDAFFYSVTCRTAGFNTVPMDAASLSPASHMLGAILMFIGASPAGTGGGIKTSVFAVLLLAVWCGLHGRRRVEILSRTIPDSIVQRAFVVVLVMFVVVSVMTLALCFTERVAPGVAMFEVTSAIGTVGLSMDLTPNLTVAGRVIIMFVMFAGRIGPLTLLVALAGQARPARYEYPMEQISIG